MTARDVIRQLSLQPHPEGGWYREWFRSKQTVCIDGRERCAVTSIYYLLEAQQLSRWHVVDAEEIWHHYQGAALELLGFEPDSARLTRHVLAASGADTEPAAVIGRGIWQAARTLGDFSLVGCTVSPGFEFADFRFVSALADHARHFERTLQPYSAWL
jgi:predicted cupin superfamily sugar epimerase